MTVIESPPFDLFDDDVVAPASRLDFKRVLDDRAAENAEKAMLKARKRLVRHTLGEAMQAADARERRWLVSRLIAEDHYGVIGAESKAGKTWLALDLALAVAFGQKWLGLWEVAKRGDVVYYVGEGGLPNTVDRLRAIADFYGYDLNEVADSIHIYERVPHLRDEAQMQVVREDLAEVRPALIVLDPAYLAMRGSQSSDLTDVGAALEEIQIAAAECAAALVVVHHWNKTGEGTGAKRFTGAGWAEWGRFLISVNVKEARAEVGDRSVVKLGYELSGGETPMRSWSVTRTVWREDPDDLNTPMHYVLSEGEAATAVTSDTSGSREAVRVVMERVSAYLGKCRGAVSQSMVEKSVTGSPTTIRFALDRLDSTGHVRWVPASRGAKMFTSVSLYRRVEDPSSTEFRPI